MDKKFVFISGLHRSGTSILHRILRSSEGISGFHDTNVPQDEGQHLQSVFNPQKPMVVRVSLPFIPKLIWMKTVLW